MGQLKTKLVIIFLIFIPAAIITGIYDLEISEYLVNQNSGWAKFLENYGMIPGLIVIMSGVYIYYSFIKSRYDFWSFFQRSIFFLVNSGLTYYLFEILLDKIVSNSLILFLTISFAINLVFFVTLQKRNPVTNPIVVKYSKVVIGMALWGYVFGIQIVKYFWGRVRFRELDTAFSQFTAWYLPQGFTGFDSFPSGHAATGFMLLAIMILLEKKKMWIKNLSLTLIILWGILLAISRIVIGAHYASDVFFGSFFIIITFLLLSRYYKKKD
jgi:membrane-associated phospholipid phosphatase